MTAARFSGVALVLVLLALALVTCGAAAPTDDILKQNVAAAFTQAFKNINGWERVEAKRVATEGGKHYAHLFVTAKEKGWSCLTICSSLQEGGSSVNTAICTARNDNTDDCEGRNTNGKCGDNDFGKSDCCVCAMIMDPPTRGVEKCARALVCLCVCACTHAEVRVHAPLDRPTGSLCIP